MRGGVGLVVALALCAVAGEAEASPQDVIGFGYRSIAMGGTGAALGEGVDAVHTNPALLSTARATSLQLGLGGLNSALHADGPGMPGDLAVGRFGASTIGGVLPLPFGGILKDRIAIGLGFITPLDVVVRGRILYPETPNYFLADRLQSVAVMAALGVDVGGGFRIGGGASALAALTGSVVVGTDASGRIGTTVEDTLIAAYAPLVGVTYDPHPHYRLGLSYRGELAGPFNAIITAENLGGITIPPLNISGVAQYDPHQWTLEAARHVGDWRLAVSATYKHWPAYPGPADATVRCEEAPDPEDCLAPPAPDPDYSPTVVARAGVEHVRPLAEGATLALRAGYAFEPTPTPEQRGRANQFGNHRSILSAGFGIGFDRSRAPLRFDGYFQAQVLHPRTHEKRAAEGAPADAEIDTGGHMIGGGTSITVSF